MQSMTEKVKDFWYYYGDVIKTVVGVTLVLVLVFFATNGIMSAYKSDPKVGCPTDTFIQGVCRVVDTELNVACYGTVTGLSCVELSNDR